MAMLQAALWVYLQSLHYVLGMFERAGQLWVRVCSWGKARAGQQNSTGSSPKPATRLAVVFAEHQESEVSDRVAAEILQWCFMADMELVLMYDPAGHLKLSAEYLTHHLSAPQGQEPSKQAAGTTDVLNGMTHDRRARSGDTCVQVGWMPQHCLPAPGGISTVTALPGAASSSGPCTCAMRLPASLPVQQLAHGSIQGLPAAQHLTRNDAKGEHLHAAAGGCANNGHAHAYVSDNSQGQAVLESTPQTTATDGMAIKDSSGEAKASFGLTTNDDLTYGVAAGTVPPAREAIPLAAAQRDMNMVCSGTDTTVAPSVAAAAIACSSQPAMRVVLLSTADAYVPVLETIQAAATCPVHQAMGPIKTPDRSHHDAAQELLARIGVVAGHEAAQEPQLILVYGSGPLTLAGFPPWLARSAEILSMGPLRRATQQGFQQALDRFCHTKQRWGK